MYLLLNKLSVLWAFQRNFYWDLTSMGTVDSGDLFAGNIYCDSGSYVFFQAFHFVCCA